MIPSVIPTNVSLLKGLIYIYIYKKDLWQFSDTVFNEESFKMDQNQNSSPDTVPEEVNKTQMTFTIFGLHN